MHKRGSSNPNNNVTYFLGQNQLHTTCIFSYVRIIYLLKRYLIVAFKFCPARNEITVPSSIFARTKYIAETERAKAKETPITKDKPQNLKRFWVFGIAEEFWVDKENSFPNHFFSKFIRVPSSLILAIYLDISTANGDPFAKI